MYREKCRSCQTWIAGAVPSGAAKMVVVVVSTAFSIPLRMVGSCGKYAPNEFQTCEVP